MNGGVPKLNHPLVLLVDYIKLIVVVTEGKITVASSHPLKGISAAGGLPHFGSCIGSIHLIAIACTTGAICSEVDIVSDSATIYYNRRLNGVIKNFINIFRIRISNVYSRGKGGCFYKLHSAGVKAVVIANVDFTIGGNGRGRGGGTTEDNLAYGERTGRKAGNGCSPEVATLAGEVNVGAIGRDGGTNVPCGYAAKRGKIIDLGCSAVTEVCFGGAIEIAAVTAEDDVVGSVYGNSDGTCPIEVVITGENFHIAIGMAVAGGADINLVIFITTVVGAVVDVIAVFHNRGIDLAAFFGAAYRGFGSEVAVYGGDTGSLTAVGNVIQFYGTAGNSYGDGVIAGGFYITAAEFFQISPGIGGSYILSGQGHAGAIGLGEGIGHCSGGTGNQFDAGSKLGFGRGRESVIKGLGNGFARRNRYAFIGGIDGDTTGKNPTAGGCKLVVDKNVVVIACCNIEDTGCRIQIRSGELEATLGGQLQTRYRVICAVDSGKLRTVAKTVVNNISIGVVVKNFHNGSGVNTGPATSAVIQSR